jgi:hypothetical protein
MPELILRPSGAGWYTQLATATPPNWSCVLNDGKSVSSSGADLIDTYAKPSHGLAEGTTINSLKLTAQMSGITNGRVVLYGQSLEQSTQFVNAGAYQTFNYTWSLNPYTGLAWTLNDVDIQEIGLILAGAEYFGGSWCRELYLTIDYTAPASTFVPKVIMI